MCPWLGPTAQVLCNSPSFSVLSKCLPVFGEFQTTGAKVPIDIELLKVFGKTGPLRVHDILDLSAAGLQVRMRFRNATLYQDFAQSKVRALLSAARSATKVQNRLARLTFRDGCRQLGT